MVEKFWIWNVSEFRPKREDHYRAGSDRVRICYRPRQWVQIQRGPFCEQSADTIV
jgi:hypothetical protein